MWAINNNARARMAYSFIIFKMINLNSSTPRWFARAALVSSFAHLQSGRVVTRERIPPGIASTAFRGVSRPAPGLLRFLSSKQNSKIYESTLLFGLAQGQEKSTDTTNYRADIQKDGYEAAQQAVTILAQRNKTWKRLAPIVELATTSSPSSSASSSSSSSSSSRNNNDRRCIADIGCDHGLLSIALAASGKFDLVIGADVSESALENGALEFHKKVMEVLQEKSNEQDTNCGVAPALPVEFRLGNGLEPLNPGEATAVCLAGMGVSTMLSILNGKRKAVPVLLGADLAPEEESATDAKQETRLLDYLQCRSLYLQAPTSRPRKLMELYETIQGMNEHGWVLSDERIMKLKKRWYITIAFVRHADDDDDDDDDVGATSSSKERNYLLPGHFLSQSQDEEQRREYSAYVQHHLSWLNKDLERNGNLCDHDMIWREANMPNADPT